MGTLAESRGEGGSTIIVPFGRTWWQGLSRKRERANEHLSLDGAASMEHPISSQLHPILVLQ